LVIPVGTDWQELKLVRKIESKIITTNIIPVRFVPMLRDNRANAKGKRQVEGEMMENLKRHIQVLSQDIGERNFWQYQNLERAADYIKGEFRKYGYEPREQIYHLEGKPYRNIIATKKGEIQSDKIIIICAHYDSVVGSPGADDNASGIAGLLELARRLAQENTKKTIKFITMVNEEPPFFMSKDMGSFQYARQVRKKGDNIEAVLCLESLGYYQDKKGSQHYPLGFSFSYPDKGNFIAVVSNFNSRGLLKRIVKEFRQATDFPLEYLVGFSFLAQAIGFSDHWSFWRFGFKAVMITDTAFYRTPYYHTQEDTLDKLDFNSLSLVIEGLHGVLLKLSEE
jgi:hypothetical protein